MEAIVSQSQALLVNEVQSGESRPGLAARLTEAAARLGGAARGMYESFHQNVDRYKAIGQTALALSGLAAGGEALNMALNADPAMAGAGNVPTRTAEPFGIADSPLTATTSATATTSSLKQECATDIFKQPEVQPDTGMYHAGKTRQSFAVDLGFGAVRAACAGYFERFAAFLPQLVRHGRTITESPGWISFFSRGEDGNAPGNAGFTYTRSLTDPNYKKWRPGDKVQFKLRLQEFSLAAKKVVAKTITTHRMKVVNRSP